MTGDGIAKVLSGVASLVWAFLAVYVVWLLRGSLVSLVSRVTGFEGWGVKFALTGGGEALDDAFEVAAKNPKWSAEATVGERAAALERAKSRRAVYEGAEILWVDDRPSNNRNESRMFRSFGGLVTFACTTHEALDALRDAKSQARPFHVIISDMLREMPPPADPKAGLQMLGDLRAAGFDLPVIFYVGVARADAGTPAAAFGLTYQPDRLLTLVGDALASVRSK
jgi:CheY-like chemotaxis protein